MIMKRASLYPFLLVWVLLALVGGGCGSDTTTPEPDSEATTDEPAPAEPAAPADTVEARTILFLGNSLSAGNGVDPDEAFPALIQDKIDSLGWKFQVINAGLSGETSAGGLRRVDWLLRQPVDVLVLELGGNDGLRGVDPASTKQNLQAIIDKTRAANPDVRIVLAGMLAPPNMGTAYFEEFQSIYPELAEENAIALIPFLLEGVAGDPALNQPDGIHPTAEGHRIVAEVVWETLRPVLEEVGEKYDCLGDPATADSDTGECVVEDWG